MKLTNDFLRETPPSPTYIICENNVVFNKNFNQSIEPFIDIISKHDGLIFADTKLSSSITMFCRTQINVTESWDRGGRFLCGNFNKPINFLPNNLKMIAFGYSFNQPIVLPNELQEFRMGVKFNQPIVLPNTLKKLVIGDSFEQEIDLPFGLEELTLMCKKHKVVDYLPHSLKTLYLGGDFDMNLDNLPSALYQLDFDKKSCFRRDLNNLPNSIKILGLPIGYTKSLLNLPDSIKMVSVSHSYDKTKINSNIKDITHCDIAPGIDYFGGGCDDY